MLTLVGIPPSPHGGRSWHMRVVVAPLPVCLSKMANHFPGRHASSRGISGHASPHSHSLCCICTANSVALPRSIIPTPSFNTQPPPASVESCPRQGLPGLIPRRLWDGQRSGPQSPSGWRRPQPKGAVGLLRWELLPVPTEAEEAGSWGKGL